VHKEGACKPAKAAAAQMVAQQGARAAASRVQTTAAAEKKSRDAGHTSPAPRPMLRERHHAPHSGQRKCGWCSRAAETFMRLYTYR
jgi:hypothetical protein